MSYAHGIHPVESLITITSTSNRSDVNLGREHQIILDKCYIVVTTLVASTASPVLQILDGSTEIATVTLDPAQAKDKQVFFVTASGVVPIRRIASGTTLGVKVKTAANGGAPAGVVKAYLAFQIGES